jgi:hypothetical protein
MVETMKPFSELTVAGKLVEVLRWLCVLPAAVFADIAAQFALDAAVRIARVYGLDILGESVIAYCLRLLLFYVSPKTALVIAGAKMAPRYQRATAIMLTLAGLLLSLTDHVVSQHLAGRRVGITHYTDLLAESAGVLCGAAYILFAVRRNRQKAISD